MTHAARLLSAHTRIRAKFGTDIDSAQWYVWRIAAGAATGSAIPCYQPDGTRGRSIIEAALMAEVDYIIHASKSGFPSAPQPGQEIFFGTSGSSRIKLKITRVTTTLLRPFYRLEAIDPQIAATTPRV